MSTVTRIAAALNRLGYNILGTDEPGTDVDGSIRLPGSKHVQVGFGYVGVVEEKDDGCYLFYNTIETEAVPLPEVVELLVRDLGDPVPEQVTLRE